MQLARLSGQPFLDLLSWHPRDVDTLWEIYAEEAAGRAAGREQAARDARFEAARQELLKRGW